MRYSKTLSCGWEDIGKFVFAPLYLSKCFRKHHQGGKGFNKECCPIILKLSCPIILRLQVSMFITYQFSVYNFFAFKRYCSRHQRTQRRHDVVQVLKGHS